YGRDLNLDYHRRLELILEAADAVAQAHRIGIVHGDIKPPNVLVGLDAKLKVVDFGAAIDVSDPSSRMRGVSPDYAGPEQLKRFEARAAFQSDVFSLAVLAYDLLAGRLPFQPAETPDPESQLELPFSPPIPIRNLNRKVGRKVEKVLLHALA